MNSATYTVTSVLHHGYQPRRITPSLHEARGQRPGPPSAGTQVHTRITDIVHSYTAQAHCDLYRALTGRHI